MTYNKQKIKSMIQHIVKSSIHGMSFSSDLWTDTTKARCYVGITIHFIYNALFYSAILGVKSFNLILNSENNKQQCLNIESCVLILYIL